MFGTVMPHLHDEVALDLAAHGFIPDIEVALETRTWHYIRTAIFRLLDTDDSWTKKAVMAVVRSRRARVPDPDARSSGLPAGREGS
jgi:hypothetical protein